MLTDDEFTVLCIAAHGQHMLAIGRWEEPVRALTLRKLMRQVDQVNYVITPEGRKAADARDQDDNQLLKQALSRKLPQPAPPANFKDKLDAFADRIESGEPFDRTELVALLRAIGQVLCTASP